MNRAQVDANDLVIIVSKVRCYVCDSSYLGLWVSIGILDSPYATSCPSVEHTLRAVRLGASGQRTLEGEEPQIVLDLCTGKLEHCRDEGAESTIPRRSTSASSLG